MDPVSQAVAIFTLVSSGVTGVVTFIKQVILAFYPDFANWDKPRQSVLLLLVSFASGVGIALSTGSNIVILFPTFSFVSPLAGVVITGFITSGGGQLFYTALIFLSGKNAPPPTDQELKLSGQAVEKPHNRGYIPFT